MSSSDRGERPFDLGDVLEDFFGVGAPITRLSARLREEDARTCHADRDGDCTWEGCPQLRDGEPEKTGRHCPLDIEDEDL